MIECIKFKSHVKGTLQGFADLRLPKVGIEIYGCSFHQKNGRRWVNMPSREYEAENGEKKYLPYVRFVEPSHLTMFIQKAVDAIERKCLENDKREDTQLPNENIPF